MLNPTHLVPRDELQSLLSACSCREARLAIELLYLTGQRPQELRLCVVGDLIAGRLRSPTLKSKRGKGQDRSLKSQSGLTREDVTRWRWIPLRQVARALEIWRELAGTRGPDEPLLPGRVDGMKDRSWLNKRWARAWKASGLRPGEEAPPLYACRHTRATMLIEAGVRPMALCRLMGWSSVQMALEYYEASPEILESAMGASAVLG